MRVGWAERLDPSAVSAYATPGEEMMRAPYERWLLTEGFLGEVFVTLTGGVFLTGLALLLGAGPVALALLSALPFLGQVGQLAAPPLERRLGSRRRFVVPAMIGCTE